VVYTTNGIHDQKSKATILSYHIIGRLSEMPRQGREDIQYEGLPEGDTGDRKATLIISLDTAADDGGMGRGISVEHIGCVIDTDRMLF
jgi:hypothetical protein